MQTTDFDYELPPEYIAQTPVTPRDSSRLLVLARDQANLTDSIFRDVGNFLNPGDLLVLNETRVIPARIFARKVPTGGKVEILLLKRIDNHTWECLIGGKGMIQGKRVKIDGGPEAEVIMVEEGAKRILHFDEPLGEVLESVGEMPLPPYIREKLEQPERYQTVFSKDPGSAAAPTAGLHFTHDLFEKLAEQGIRFAKVVLHVGLDTFAPVHEDDPRDHKIHTEWCQLGPETASLIRETKRAGGRVIAVGTTSVRTLESAAQDAEKIGIVKPFDGHTRLFILPGYEFKVVDAMITNFHLPKSTLLMLVSAFVGRERILEAYETAKIRGYRFFSFGDAMLLL